MKGWKRFKGSRKKLERELFLLILFKKGVIFILCYHSRVLPLLFILLLSQSYIDYVILLDQGLG